MGEKPKDEGEKDAEQKTSDDRKIKGGVATAMDDVARKASEAKREFTCEIEQTAEKNEKTAEEKKSAAEIAKRIHAESVEEARGAR